jgi:hypothetical protein
MPANQLSQSAGVVLGHEMGHGIGLKEGDNLAGAEAPLRDAAGETMRTEYGPDKIPVPTEVTPEGQEIIDSFVEKWTPPEPEPEEETSE